VGETGVLGGRAIRAFHDEASTALLDAGLLRLFGVYLDEAPIASLIALFARGRAYLYLQGFDPAFERLSPGLLATACAIDQAFVEGTMVVDFLRGQERYKYLWGAHDELTYRRILTPI
jgi:CelD/BcsL family acetyltransferase involved in cellulose biosynthesis